MDPKKLFFALLITISIGGRPLAAEHTSPAEGKVQVQIVEEASRSCRQLLADSCSSGQA